MGDQVRIANTLISFVTDLNNAYQSPTEPPLAETGETTAAGWQKNAAGPEETGELLEPTVITHRRQNTRLLEAPQMEGAGEAKLGSAAAKLCKLAFDLARQNDQSGIAQIAINGLVDGTQADAGAVLAVHREDSGEPKLRVLASRSDRLPTYRTVSRFLADTVMREGEAVLARDVEGDSKLGIRDSQGEILSTSVICAPIRWSGRIVGLIHLYTTDPATGLDPVDLEFTLAVAENLAVALNSSIATRLADEVSKSRNELMVATLGRR
ncbi:MAG: GAF domain-containing protein [Pirellulaceae bacterium]